MINWIDTSDVFNSSEATLRLAGHHLTIHCNHHPNKWRWHATMHYYEEDFTIASGRFDPSLTKKQVQDRAILEIINYFQQSIEAIQVQADIHPLTSIIYPSTTIEESTIQQDALLAVYHAAQTFLDSEGYSVHQNHFESSHHLPPPSPKDALYEATMIARTYLSDNEHNK